MILIAFLPFAQAEDEFPVDDLDSILEELEKETPSSDTLFGLGTLANSTQTSMLESRLRYRQTNRIVKFSLEIEVRQLNWENA